MHTVICKVFDESNNVLSKYTHSSLRIDDALAIDDKANNRSYYFLKDHLGSVIDIVIENLSFKQHYAYSSFGELQKVKDIGGGVIASNPILEHHFAYTEREYDQESGLYHYRARAYDASIGRFLQVDGLIVVAVQAVTNEIVYADDKEKRNRNRGYLAVAAMLIVTNGQYGWETMAYSAGYAAVMSSIQADSAGGGDWEDYLWKNMATFFVAKYATDWGNAKEPFFMAAFAAYGTMYSMGDNYETCRKKFRNKWSDGKVQGGFCAGAVYAGVLAGS